MKRIDPEELLWELAAADDGGETREDRETPSDEALAAYRAGELPAPERERVEHLLVASSAARERLRELAGIAPPAPPAKVRRRLLGAAASTWGSGWLAAAALLAVALGTGWYLAGRGHPAALPANLTFDVSLELLADVRAGSGAAGEGTAYADTPVRVVVEPEDAAVAGLEFGLYRRRGDTLERLSTGAGLELELGRGTAVFTAPAGRLVGAEPGPKELLVAVARAGRLPATLTLASGDEALARLAEASGGRTYRRTIILLTTPGRDEPAN